MVVMRDRRSADAGDSSVLPIWPTRHSDPNVMVFEGIKRAFGPGHFVDQTSAGENTTTAKSRVGRGPTDTPHDTKQFLAKQFQGT